MVHTWETSTSCIWNVNKSSVDFYLPQAWCRLLNQCLNRVAFTILSFQLDRAYISEHLCFMASVLWFLKGFNCSLLAGSSTQGFHIVLPGTSLAWMFTVFKGFEPWLRGETDLGNIPYPHSGMSVIDNCCHHGCHLTNLLTASVPLWQHLSLVKAKEKNMCEDTHQANIYLWRQHGVLHSSTQSRSRTIVFTTPRVTL